MGENICKLCEWQEVNIKKIQTAHNQYRRKKKNKSHQTTQSKSEQVA